MKIEVRLLSNDSEIDGMLWWSLRHYTAFADRVIVHDGGPEWKSSAVIFAKFPGVAALKWDTAGELNDELAMRLKNECWRGTDADWVIVADMDELVWASDMRARLEQAGAQGAAVLRPHGFEMFSDRWFDFAEYGVNPEEQITRLAPDGAPDDKWYAKPVIFSPARVSESGFGIGAHESRPVLRDTRRIVCDRAFPFADPPLYLLHYKSIFGGIDRIAARYDATRSRLSLINVSRGWGNFQDGRVHALEKRDRLLPHVRRVIA